jgi:DNA-binding GntR family transcriptional regulator
VLVQLEGPGYAGRMASTTSRFNAQVADALRADIAAGRLKPGEKLPSVRELTERFGNAQETVRKGLAALVDEGLIRPNSTRGYFVSDGAASAAGHSEVRLEDLARQVAELAGRVDELEGLVRGAAVADEPSQRS